MSNSRKRLIKNEAESKSNHTEVLSDIEEGMDFEEYRYNPSKSNQQKQQQQQPKKLNQNNIQPEKNEIKMSSQVSASVNKIQEKPSVKRIESQSSQKPSAQKQTNLFSYFKNPSINPINKQTQPIKQQNISSIDIDEIDIEEQKAILRKIEEQNQQKKQKQNQEIYEQQFNPSKNKSKKIEVEKDDDIINQLKLIQLNNEQNKQKQSKNLGPDITQKSVQYLNKPEQKKKKGGVEISWDQSKVLVPFKKQQQIQEEKQIPTFQNDPDLLKGQTIVLSGLLSVCSRDKLEEFLKNNGAKVTGSISGKTNYLIVGEKLEDGRRGEEGNKFKAAKAKGTKIIKEDELDDWFQEKLGVGLENVFMDTNLSKLYKNSDAKKPIQIVQQINGQSLADKYMPQSLKELVGNKASVTQLNDWIKKFQNPNSSNEEQNSKQKKKFIPMKMGRFQQVGNLSSKACIISGPPGIGKTSLVRLVAEALNLKTIINNASDKRNKLSLRNILNDLIDNRVLMNLFRPNKEFLIIMDEVDGMTGSDRGGIAALIECVKSTRVPIICICNDIDHKKLQSLLTHCYSIKCQKPDAKLVAQRLKYICEQEKINIDENDLEKIAECFDCDIRQCINMLELQKIQTLGSKNLQPQGFKKDKVCVFNTFNASQTLLNKESRKNLSLRDMMDLFFLDYDLIPLIVQDSFIKAQHSDIKNIAKAAELIAEGDVISKKIRKQQQWSLMPSYGFLSSVYPSTIVGDSLEFPRFPTWLGKNSTASKIRRESYIIKNRLAPVTFLTSDISLYSKYIFKLIKQYLELKIIRNEKNAVWEVVQILEYYRLSPDQLKDELQDQIFNPLKENILASIDKNTKAQLTKMYNKRHQIMKEKKQRRQGATQRQLNENYNPLVGEEAPLVEQYQMEQEEEEEQKKMEEEEKEIVSKQKTQKQKKNSKKQTKKNTKQKSNKSDSIFDEERSQDNSMAESMANFLADDDEDI